MANMTNEAITPEEIRAIRETLGMSQAQFASEIGVDQSRVSRWEKGENPPSRVAMKVIRKMSGDRQSEGEAV